MGQCLAFAWNARTGESLWSLRNGCVGPTFGTAVSADPMVIDGGIVFVTAADRVSALNMKDGSTKWTSDLTRVDDCGEARRLWCGSPTSNGRLVVEVAAKGQTIQAAIPPCYSIVICGEVVYAVAMGRLHALDRQNGERLWACDFGGAPSGELRLDKDMLYFGTAKGNPVQDHSDGGPPADGPKALPPGLHALKLK